MGILWSSAAFALLMAQTLSATTGGALPRVIKPDVYPEECIRKTDRIETIVVEFDTTAMGEPLKPVIITSTNACLNEAALASLAQSRFLGAGINAGLNPRRHLRASIIFDRIYSPSAPERKLRRSVRHRLNRVLKNLAKGDNPSEALVRLDEIQQKFGDDFSLAEFAAHRMLCAAARSELGDINGALADLYAVEETGLTDVTSSMTGANLSEIRDELKKAKK